MRIFFLNLAAILFVCFFANFSALALSPENHLENPKDEERAMNLFLQVRCLVCQGQVVENSDSEFSREMRQLIREKISQNKSDQEIKAELVAEFGEDILVNHGLQKKSIALWIIPIFSMFIAAFVIFRKVKIRHS